VSSANRERRQRNREARTAAQEEALGRARRQRLTFAIVGLALALVVGIALVARATSGNDSSAASTTSTTLAPTSTTVPAPRRCVAMQKPAPQNTPVVPVVVGKPPTKLVTRDLQVGTGAAVKAGDTLIVNYVGVVCSTGRVFSSSYGTGAQPFALKRAIPGMSQGIPGMRVGGERLLGIPPALAYGSQGISDGSVGPDDALWFLVQVQKAEPT
jgi:peptidylprolyl isomerase